MNLETVKYVFMTDPTIDERFQIIHLYRDAGWWGEWPDDAELVARLISGSHCFLCVFDEKKLIGMGRAISDGVSDAYIQDVAVRSECRHRGIGGQIVDKLVSRLEKDGIGWIALIAERGSRPFYQPLGFTVMENSFPMLKRTK